MLIKLGQRGTLTVPKQLRKGLDRHALFHAVRRDDGVIEFIPIDPDQAWFWTARWQRMEREADEDIAAGRFETFDDVESFIADLEARTQARKPRAKKRSRSE